MNFLKKLTHKIFQLFGYDFLLYIPHNFITLRRSKILINEDIDLVLDIGANKGSYVPQLRNFGYSKDIISFEPLSVPFAILKERSSNDPFWECKNVAIGNTVGEIEINVSGHETSSSILGITGNHLQAMPSSEIVAQERVKITTLDTILSSETYKARRIYIKIDVQGYEKHVLEGARDILSKTHAIEIELSFSPMYHEAPLYREMIDYLDELGFKLVSIEPVFSDPKTYHMLQADGIFLKK